MTRRNRPQHLDRLEAKLIVQPRAAADAFDLSRLTAAEQQALARLAGKTCRLPTGRWDFSALDDRELDWLKVLVRAGRKSGDGGSVARRDGPAENLRATQATSRGIGDE